MTYRYKYDVNNKLLRNRLYHVNDAIAANVDDTDIDDMGAFVSNSLLIETANNYSYDEEGRLIKDTQEGIERITWRVDGKVKSIERPSDSGKKNVSFDYNAFGNRIAKHVFDDNWNLEKSTYYILDAQGNQLSMYEHTVDSNQVNFTLAERNIYGASNLGTYTHKVNMYATLSEQPISTVLGERYYLASEHRSNVLTVFSDIKIPQTSDNITVDGYNVFIVNISDYSGFGVELDGRTIKNGNFRYGFQGQEKDDVVKGEGNSVNYKYRMHDPRLGRFFAVDPLAHQFPAWSPYVAFADNPLRYVDPDGRAPQDWIKKKDSNTWDYDSSIQSPEQATAKYGEGTEYKDDGGTYQGRYNGESVGTITLNTGGLQTWDGGSYQNKDLNPYPTSPTLSNPFNWYDPFSQANTLLGGGSSLAGLSNSSFRLTNGAANGSGFSPKLYTSGWTGGSRAKITTHNVGKVGGFLSRVSFGLGVGMDVVGVFNYYKNGAEDPNAVHPAKAVTNTGFGAMGLKLNPLASAIYFGVDAFYPGGWTGDGVNPGAIMDQDRLIRKNQEVIPNFNLYRDLPGGF